MATVTPFSALIFVYRYVIVVGFRFLYTPLSGTYLGFHCAFVYGYLQYPHCSRPDTPPMSMPLICTYSPSPLCLESRSQLTGVDGSCLCPESPTPFPSLRGVVSINIIVCLRRCNIQTRFHQGELLIRRCR